MKVGLLADIHGNWPALEAVLDDMEPVDSIVCAGDVIGYNPFPKACLNRVLEIADVTVQGNHDRAIGSPESAPFNQMAIQGLKYARSELSEEDRQWLINLPEQATFHNGEYLVVHSHPEHIDRYVRKREFTTLVPYLEGYSGLVLGHTHQQAIECFDEGFVVNPGSMGQPRDGDPDAAYAILDTETNDIGLHRVSYDIDQVYEKVLAGDLPTKIGERLYDGR